MDINQVGRDSDAISIELASLYSWGITPAIDLLKIIKDSDAFEPIPPDYAAAEREHDRMRAVLQAAISLLRETRAAVERLEVSERSKTAEETLWHGG